MVHKCARCGMYFTTTIARITTTGDEYCSDRCLAKAGSPTISKYIDKRIYGLLVITKYHLHEMHYFIVDTFQLFYYYHYSTKLHALLHLKVPDDYVDMLDRYELRNILWDSMVQYVMFTARPEIYFHKYTSKGHFDDYLSHWSNLNNLKVDMVYPDMQPLHQSFRDHKNQISTLFFDKLERRFEDEL